MIKLLCWNKGNSSFARKKDEIEMLVNDHSPVALGILEANIEIDCHLPSIAIEGYSYELDNMCEDGVKTRAVMFIKDGTSYSRRRDLEPKCSPAIWLEIKDTPSKPYLLFMGYREWRSAKDDDKQLSGNKFNQMKRLNEWSMSWKRAEEEGKMLILMGDFNVDIMPWIDQADELTDYQASQRHYLDKLKLMCSQNNLGVLKTGATRFQGTQKASTIDIILSNKSELLDNPLLLNSSSDHKVICIHKIQKRSTVPPMIRKARCYKKYSKNEMLQHLNIPAINALLCEVDTEYVATNLVNIINYALNIVAPIKKIQIRNKYAAHLSN